MGEREGRSASASTGQALRCIVLNILYPACGAARSSLERVRDWSHLALIGSPWKTARMPSYPLSTHSPTAVVLNPETGPLPAELKCPPPHNSLGMYYSVLHGLVPALFTCH